MPDQWNHDLGLEFLALFCQFKRGFEDSACLHDVDLGEEQAQATAAQAEHRVHLAHCSHGFEHLAFLLQCLLFARIICCTMGRRSCSMNMCSVRQSPMPSAPKVTARRASRG